MKHLLIFIVLISGITFAQEDTTNVELNSVEVTGVRAGDKDPITSTTVNRSDIKTTYQGQEVAFILDKTPSITSSTDGGHPMGYTYFRLRGIDQTRINMTLNGVPLNEPEDQGVYFSNYPGFSNNIKSMQIQRGVGTSSNGTASYGGSINFESPTGFNKGTEIALGYGSFNTMRFNASNSTGLTDKKLALFTNFSTFQTDGYKNNSGSKGYSFFMSGGYYGKSDVVKVTAFTGRSFNQMAWAAVSEDDIANNPRTNYNTPIEDDDFMQSFAQIQHTHRFKHRKVLSGLEFMPPRKTYSLLTTTAYYNRLDGDWDLDLGPLGGGTDVLNFQLGSNLLGVMTNYKYSGTLFNLNIGLHGNMYNRDHAMAILPDVNTTFYTNTGYKHSLSGFAKASYDLRKFTLFADAQLRYTNFRYVGATSMPNLDWTFFNPKGGVTYNGDNWKLYASVGQAHREPTRNDMFGGEDDLISYSEVTPESVIDYELGFNHKWDKLNLSANVYYMDFKNEITLIGALGSNGLPLMTNVENSFRSGFEFQGEYKPMKELSIYNNTSLSYSRITDGGTQTQPLYTPPVVSNTGVMFTHKGFFAGVNIKYHSSSYIDFDNVHTTPQFLVLGGDIGFTYRGYTLTGKIHNITDTQYYTNGYSIGNTRYFYVNAPISGYVTLKIAL